MTTAFNEEQLTLSEFIDALKALTPADNIRFDFGYMAPTEPASYRGFYDHLAFGYEEKADLLKVADVLAWAEEALGQTYEGYKGGLYKMHSNTPLWVANYSEVPGTAIVGVLDLNYGHVLIETAYVEV